MSTADAGMVSVIVQVADRTVTCESSARVGFRLNGIERQRMRAAKSLQIIQVTTKDMDICVPRGAMKEASHVPPQLSTRCGMWGPRGAMLQVSQAQRHQCQPAGLCPRCYHAATALTKLQPQC